MGKGRQERRLNLQQQALPEIGLMSLFGLKRDNVGVAVAAFGDPLKQK